ncbi:MAG TPA: ABC transporter permease [Ilumatobacteraceae bacterium]|nr:ABC transporter permease [Ilumatobacteraceae bacterium]
MTVDVVPTDDPIIDEGRAPRWGARLVGVLGQLGQLLAVLFAVSLLTFLLLDALPGSAVDSRIGPLPNFSPADRAELVASMSKQLGLDKPLAWQYVIWVKNAFTGDFGVNYQGIEVSHVVGERLTPTLELGVASIIISTVGALLISLFGFRTRWRAIRAAIQGGATVLLVVPAFWLGLILVIIFAAELGWLPSAGFVPFGDDAGENLRFLVLPAVTLALPQLALFYRYLDAGLRDVSTASFITAARARGISERDVAYRHVLPNAILPTVTVIGLVAGSLISGLVIVESVFSWPGLGLLLVDSVKSKDYNTVAAVVLLTAFAYVVVAFMVDVAYRLLDPRTRRQS